EEPGLLFRRHHPSSPASPTTVGIHHQHPPPSSTVAEELTSSTWPSSTNTADYHQPSLHRPPSTHHPPTPRPSTPLPTAHRRSVLHTITTVAEAHRQPHHLRHHQASSPAPSFSINREAACPPSPIPTVLPTTKTLPPSPTITDHHQDTASTDADAQHSSCRRGRSRDNELTSSTWPSSTNTADYHQPSLHRPPSTHHPPTPRPSTPLPTAHRRSVLHTITTVAEAHRQPHHLRHHQASSPAPSFSINREGRLSTITHPYCFANHQDLASFTHHHRSPPRHCLYRRRRPTQQLPPRKK
ncbi:hypothetical protein Dimus_001860, partial [Dionaea muscipula]